MEGRLWGKVVAVFGEISSGEVKGLGERKGIQNSEVVICLLSSPFLES